MSWSENHSRSERAATEAELALRAGDIGRAEALYSEAARFEAAALSSLSPQKVRTLGITAVSAVALWYKARNYAEAERIAYRSLADGVVPEFAVGQLQELLHLLWTAAAADRAGRRFVRGDVLVSVKGGVVVHGGAPLDLIQRKVEGIQAVLFRVVEMLMRTPVRRRGGPSQEIQDLFRPWLFQAPAGSYQFAVRIEESPQLRLFGGYRPELEQITSTFFAVLRAAAHDPEVHLDDLVPDRDYREVFLNLSRNLAPTGKTFERLDVRDASAPAQEPISFELTSRRDINSALRRIKPPKVLEVATETVQTVGTLRGLHLDQDWLEILPDGGAQTVRIDGAGDVLDDVVGPMVNHRVVVTATRRKGKLVFQDIEAEE